MHPAASGGSVEVLKWLKQQGVPANAKCNQGTTPLFHAASYGHVEAMKWLKAQGADVNAKDKNGMTPMFHAAESGQIEVMQWLKDQGANVNAKTKDGSTPMNSAAWKGSKEAMKWLKEQGVPDIWNYYPFTAYPVNEKTAVKPVYREVKESERENAIQQLEAESIRQLSDAEALQLCENLPEKPQGRPFLVRGIVANVRAYESGDRRVLLQKNMLFVLHFAMGSGSDEARRPIVVWLDSMPKEVYVTTFVMQ